MPPPPIPARPRPLSHGAAAAPLPSRGAAAVHRFYFFRHTLTNCKVNAALVERGGPGAQVSKPEHWEAYAGGRGSYKFGKTLLFLAAGRLGQARPRPPREGGAGPWLRAEPAAARETGRWGVPRAR